MNVESWGTVWVTQLKASSVEIVIFLTFNHGIVTFLSYIVKVKFKGREVKRVGKIS